MNIRDQRQDEAFEAWKENMDGIINACPRFGKTRVGIRAMNYVNGRVLIIAPRVDIFKQWEADLKEFPYTGTITYGSFRALQKLDAKDFDLVIIDEIHESSAAQRKEIYRFVDKCKAILGLSGTITKKTEEELIKDCGLEVVYKYSISQGVEEGILADYVINLHYVDLDRSKVIRTTKKGYRVTEKSDFDLYSRLRTKAKQKFFYDIKLISIIQRSVARTTYTRALLKKFENQRVLVFAGLTEVADSLEIPVYHSKSKDREVFDSFCSGDGLHMATIKMMQAGITIKPINIGIINYTSGNPEDTAQKISRFLGFEYDNPTKKAFLHVICTNEPFEINRIKTALMFFDKEKIRGMKE